MAGFSLAPRKRLLVGASLMLPVVFLSRAVGGFPLAKRGSNRFGSGAFGYHQASPPFTTTRTPSALVFTTSPSMMMAEKTEVLRGLSTQRSSKRYSKVNGKSDNQYGLSGAEDKAESSNEDNFVLGMGAAQIQPLNDEATEAAAAAFAARRAAIVSNYDIRRFSCASYLLIQASAVGIVTGWSVGIFKMLIDVVKTIAYAGIGGTSATASAGSLKAWQKLLWLPFIPALGGVLVALLSKLGGGFPPGLKGVIESTDKSSGNIDDADYDAAKAKEMTPSSAAYHPIFYQFRFLKKTLAAIITLGTGSSLGPEGPAVEIGANLSRLITDIFPARKPPTNEADPREYNLQQRRLLLACGTAAGVSAGFNAPLAGAFFVLEIVQAAFTSIDKNRYKEVVELGSSAMPSASLDMIITPTLTATGSVSAILLSSVLSALVCKSLLGEHLHLALTPYSMTTPLLELPLYLLLGVTSGLAAFVFTQLTEASSSLFRGKLGPKVLRRLFAKMPPVAKPALGGLICGLVGLVFPQILFNGFDTLNVALANRTLPTLLLLQLLGMKMLLTAVSAGSGLVGGTFAPSLFLGGMVGASFHNIASGFFATAAQHGSGVFLATPMLQMADLPAYTMVGAATVLAAVFRAPLTASLLLFEMTRDYGAILPLMASSGVASIVGDILEAKQELVVAGTVTGDTDRGEEES